jgi:hypothetical protein
MEIGGDRSKDGVSTAMTNVSGNTSRARGFHVTTMESADKFFVWYQGTGTSKNGAPLKANGNLGIYRRSGRLKGIKGMHIHLCASG